MSLSSPDEFVCTYDNVRMFFSNLHIINRDLKIRIEILKTAENKSDAKHLVMHYISKIRIYNKHTKLFLPGFAQYFSCVNLNNKLVLPYIEYENFLPFIEYLENNFSSEILRDIFGEKYGDDYVKFTTKSELDYIIPHAPKNENWG